MSKKLSVLFVGETKIALGGCVQGYDLMLSARYEEPCTLMKELIEGLGHEFTCITSHLIARDFPRTLEALLRYNVVLFSDIGSNTFLLLPEVCAAKRSVNLLKLVKQYVENGGGFGMIGGYLSFTGYEGKGKYKGTAIEKILPVELLTYDDRVEVPEGADLCYNPSSHAVLNGLPTEWPFILGYNRFIAKPGASVLVEYEGDPIIALWDCGAGRTMAYATDCTAHWAPREMTSWEHYPTLWQNLLCWLARK